MVMQVNQELCAGCGACMDACSVGAIHLVDHRAEIDNTLCTGCETCIETCPNGAIIAIAIPSHNLPNAVLLVAGYREISDRQPTALPESSTPITSLKPLAGTVLTFLGSEVAPRLVDILMSALERRFTRPTTASITPSPTSSSNLSAQRRGRRRQARYRQGRIGNGNFRGRR